MQYYEITLRGVLANPNTLAHHLDDFKTFFGLQEGNSSIYVKPTDRATFRIPRQVDFKRTLASENKNEFVKIGGLDLPVNALLNSFLVAKENAFGAGYLVGQEAKKNLEMAALGGVMGDFVVKAIEVGRGVAKKEAPLSTPHKSASVLFTVLTGLNDKRNKERVAIGLPNI